MKLDLLAIAPHPDDVELTCGGTMSQDGRRPAIAPAFSTSHKAKPAPAAPGDCACARRPEPGRSWGFRSAENLGLPDAHLKRLR